MGDLYVPAVNLAGCYVDFRLGKFRFASWIGQSLGHTPSSDYPQSINQSISQWMDLLIQHGDLKVYSHQTLPKFKEWNLTMMVSKRIMFFSGADFQVNHVQLQQCIPKMKFSHHEDENKRYIMFRYPDLKLHVPLLLGGASPPKLYVFCCWCIFWELIIQENDNININQEVTQKKLQNDRTRLVLFLVDSRLKKNNLMIQWYACIHMCIYIYVNIFMWI